MAVKILHKRGSRPPQPDDLDVGEVALNTLEGKAYTKKDDGTVVEITGGESAGAGLFQVRLLRHGLSQFIPWPGTAARQSLCSLGQSGDGNRFRF